MTASVGKAAHLGTWWASSLAFHGFLLVLVPPFLLATNRVPDEPMEMIVRHCRRQDRLRLASPERERHDDPPPIDVPTVDATELDTPVLFPDELEALQRQQADLRVEAGRYG